MRNKDEAIKTYSLNHLALRLKIDELVPGVFL